MERKVKVGDIILHKDIGFTQTISEINGNRYKVDNKNYMLPTVTLKERLEKNIVRIISQEEKEYVDSVRRHMDLVRDIMGIEAYKLWHAGNHHDESKWQDDEFGPMSRAFPIKKKAEYNSSEYNEAKESIKDAINLHYQRNPNHHPQGLLNGIRDMTLGNLIEMVADWCAAAHDTPNGDVFRSIEINQETFGYSDDLKAILINTARQIKDENEI